MTSRRNQEDRKRVNARKAAEGRKSGFVSTTLRIPDGVKLYEFKPFKGIKRWDILEYIVGERNNAPGAEPGMAHFEMSYLSHRGMGAEEKGQYICPRTIKKPCPICEYRSKLIKDGASWEDPVVKALRARERQLFLLYDLDDLDAGLQLLDMSFHLFGKFLDDQIEASDEDEGLVYFASHGEDGLTLRVSFEEKNFAGNKFPNAIAISFKPRKKPYPDDLIEKLPCLDDLLIIESYDKLNKILLEGEADDEGEEEEKNEKPRSQRKPPRAEEEDDDQDEEDEEEVVAKKPAKKKREPVSAVKEKVGKSNSKPVVVDEDDEIDDDEDDDDEEDEDDWDDDEPWED